MAKKIYTESEFLEVVKKLRAIQFICQSRPGETFVEDMDALEGAWYILEEVIEKLKKLDAALAGMTLIEDGDRWKKQASEKTNLWNRLPKRGFFEGGADGEQRKPESERLT